MAHIFKSFNYTCICTGIAQYLRRKNKVKLVIHDSECIFIENWKLYYMYRSSEAELSKKCCNGNHSRQRKPRLAKSSIKETKY